MEGHESNTSQNYLNVQWLICLATWRQCKHTVNTTMTLWHFKLYCELVSTQLLIFRYSSNRTTVSFISSHVCVLWCNIHSLLIFGLYQILWELYGLIVSVSRTFFSENRWKLWEWTTAVQLRARQENMQLKLAVACLSLIETPAYGNWSTPIETLSETVKSHWKS